MTRKEQDKLRKALYNAKFTTDAEDENPFVGIYFDDLLDIIHDFGQQHPQWIPVEERLPEECELVYAIREGNVEPGIYKFMAKDQWEWAPRFIACLDDITHWMPLPAPPQGKEDNQ